MRMRRVTRDLILCLLCSQLTNGSAQAEFRFSDAVYYHVGFGAGPFVIGDFDRDSDADMALGNLDFGTVSLLLNNGQGVLGSPVHLQVAESVAALAAGDLDGDSDLDLVVADEGTFEKSISMLINDGSGFFEQGARTVLFDADEDPNLHFRGVVLADFNLDGLLDAAIGCESSHQTMGFVEVAVNTGEGRFDSAASLPIGEARLTSPNNLVAGDFGGGRTGLFSVNSSKQMVYYQATVDGAFDQPASIALTSEIPTSVIGGDLDSDGDEDLLLTADIGGTARVIFNDSDLDFTRTQTVATGATRPGAAALGDLDGDGDPDLAVAESILFPNLGTPTIFLAANDGAGDFQPALELGFGEFPSVPEWVETADLDGDGDLDILATDRIEGNLAVYFNQRVPAAVSSADLNDDGGLDLLDLLVIGNGWYRESGL